MKPLLLFACIAAFNAVPAFADDLPPTPAQPRGPFYPRTLPAERDNDLAHVGNRVAEGQHMVLQGRILRQDAKPVPGARVEIWQADARGRYHQVGAAGEDPGFQGWGETTTDGLGAYRFVTVLPAPTEDRPAHIHFAVTPPGGKPFYTQLYFAEGKGNAEDPLYSALQGEERDRVLTKPQQPAADQPVTATFEIVVP